MFYLVFLCSMIIVHSSSFNVLNRKSMYPRKSIARQGKNNNVLCDDIPPFESSNEYHSFGFYVLGGLDITGEHTQLTNKVVYDNAEDVDNGASVDALSDPTTSFFGIAEQLGAEVAEEVVENK